MVNLVYWFLAFLAANPEFLRDSDLMLLEDDIVRGGVIAGIEVGAIISLPTTFFKAFIFDRISPKKNEGVLKNTRKEAISLKFLPELKETQVLEP